jgi:hypothetical protein
VSANHYVDNAATQAREIIDTIPRDFELIFYPTFSPNGALPLEDVLLIREQQKFFMRNSSRNLISTYNIDLNMALLKNSGINCRSDWE